MSAAQAQAVVLETDNRATAAMERSHLYGFLAAVFRTEPTVELLAEIRKAPFQDALKAVGSDLADSLSGASEKKLLEDLAVEYARLFLGPGNHVAPYAAIYLAGDGASLWGPETIWVKQFIEAAGFEYKADYFDLPDHIAVELEFMQEIAANEAAALERQDLQHAETLQRIEEEFVTTHMAKWVPKFCRQVQNRAELPFYRVMACLTEDFIGSETAL
ncbi:MAG: molecular chaperone TorD family protein [Rhodospirillales bacterium]|nr:molecular chaperone TorD family protein [Rhodospirillales bacterium]